MRRKRKRKEKGNEISRTFFVPLVSLASTTAFKEEKRKKEQMRRKRKRKEKGNEIS
jgi:hypothetical protein